MALVTGPELLAALAGVLALFGRGRRGGDRVRPIEPGPAPPRPRRMGRIARGLLPLLRPLVRPEACPALRDLLRSLRARELAPEVFWSAWAELPGLAPEAHRELRPIVARYLATRDQPAVPQVNSLQREDPSRLMARAMLEALIECLDRLAQSSEVIPAADPDGRGTEAAPVRSER